MTRRVLLIEYLLADQDAWSDACDSMHAEAIAMLTAVAADFGLLPETEPTLLLSPQSCKALLSAGRLEGNFRVEETASGPAEWLDQHADKADSFTAILLIAPEYDSILVSLLSQLQHGPWKTVCCLNLASRLAAMFSDKRATGDWLRRHRVPTPETKLIGQQKAAELLDRHTRTAERCVLKPRYGAGSDRVHVIPLSREEFTRLRDEALDQDSEWIVQPLISGKSCSVGLIGGGHGQPALILPPVSQIIQLHGDQFRYCGGQLPCEPRLASAVTQVAEQVASVLGAFSGYVGIDVVVSPAPHGDLTGHVIEINPRLCTSYVGYRVLCEGNLAASLLQQPSSENKGWKSGAVVFDATGQTSLSPEPA